MSDARVELAGESGQVRSLERTGGYYDLIGRITLLSGCD
jgi:hypothetical protein